MKSFTLLFFAFIFILTGCAPYTDTKNTDNNTPGDKPGNRPTSTQLTLANEELKISTDTDSFENTFEVTFDNKIEQLSKSYYFTMGDTDANFMIRNFNLNVNLNTCRSIYPHFFLSDGFEQFDEVRHSQTLLLKKYRTYHLHLSIDILSCKGIKSSFIFKRLN